MKNGERFKTSLLLAVIILSVATVIVVIRQMNGQQIILPVTEKMPVTGFAPNDTKGKVLGNPQNGIDDLQAIYALRQKYRSQFDDFCRQPDAISPYGDIIRNPIKYGFHDTQEFMRAFTNPDDHYGDILKSKVGAIPYSMPCRRLDGTLVGSAKANGTRDVIAYTDLYYFRNARYFPHEKETLNPVGFYLVLWDDGQIEKVPYYDVVFSKSVQYKDGRTIAFKGQSGLLPDVITYDQDYVRMGMKRGPRGKEGGKGELPDDLIINPKKK